MDSKHAKLIDLMIEYDKGDAKRIQHFLKVHDFSAAIGILEGIDRDTQFVLETAAIVHDIGIHKAEEKYGSAMGKYQEIEGPGEAEMLLKKAGGYSEHVIERVKYIVGHHHTYSEIDGLDYQILVEADFLVNLYENNSDFKAILASEKNIFKTETGKRMLINTFGRDYL